MPFIPLPKEAHPEWVDPRLNPTVPYEVDWDDELTRGLERLYAVTPSGIVDLTNERPISNGEGAGYTNDASVRNLLRKSASTGLEYDIIPLVDRPNCTIGGVFFNDSYSSDSKYIGLCDENSFDPFLSLGNGFITNTTRCYTRNSNFNQVDLENSDSAVGSDTFVTVSAVRVIGGDTGLYVNQDTPVEASLGSGSFTCDTVAFNGVRFDGSNTTSSKGLQFVWLYKRALTAAEVKELHANPKRLIKPVEMPLFFVASQGLTRIQSDLALSWSALERINSDADLIWSALNRVNSDAALSWSILNRVSNDCDLSWNTLERVDSDAAISWSIIQRITSDNVLSWSALERINSDSDLSWSALSRVSSDADISWAVLERIQADADISWSLLQRINSDAELLWNINSALSRISSDLTMLWNIEQRVFQSMDMSWNILNRVLSDGQLAWSILNRVSSDLATSFNIQNRIVSDFDIEWSLLSRTESTLIIRYNIGIVDITLPEGRTFIVDLENRTFQIASESRTFTVAAESRTFKA